ncbi:helix-turn-helix domain-containing protein [Thermodesulfovibrio sp.]|uniref:helix-turn-helix domain-containing protein n=1 Tax=Thermodesulfovibrio sp. TaxID=2067987 RepID=UPI003094B2B1
MEKLMTTKEVAEILKVSPELIGVYRRKKGLPAIKLGHKTVRYKLEQVLEWLKINHEK